MDELDTSHAGRELPEGWVVWSEEDGLVLCYRPDVFDGSRHPRPCLPLLTVTRADVGTVGGREGWRVSFHVEADVEATRLRSVEVDYGDAVDYAVELAEEFVEGELDPGEFYAEGDVRQDYVDRLRRETGGDPDD